MPPDFVGVTQSSNGANGEESGSQPERIPIQFAARVLFQPGNRDRARRHESRRLYLRIGEFFWGGGWVHFGIRHHDGLKIGIFQSEFIVRLVVLPYHWPSHSPIIVRYNVD